MRSVSVDGVGRSAKTSMELVGIHHIDFVVRDLDAAMTQYRRLFGVEFLEREALPSRGVELARFRLGSTWIVLVQPVTQSSPVQEFLNEHGEGFYHIAYQVRNAKEAAEELKTKGVKLMKDSPRTGVDGWTLTDLQMEETFGLMTQLVQPS